MVPVIVDSCRFPLSLFDGLVQETQAADALAPTRRLLVERAQRMLSGADEADETQRQDLAQQFEQWRYQVLRNRSGRLDAAQRSSIDAIDLASAALAGRAARAPRWPRAAIRDHRCGDAEVARVAQCLDRAIPLEQICWEAAKLTASRYSVPASDTRSSSLVLQRRMLLYAPLYLSSHCINHCVYCGFRAPLPIERKHLDFDEAMHQAEILQHRGFRHILLVAGDFPSLTTTEYFVRILRELAARGVRPSVEIAPQTTASYAEMAAAGACGLTLFQETYDETLYGSYHPLGSKASYDWRLEGYERAAEAGIARLGLGILVGLADPREDLEAMVRHAVYLQSRFPACTLGFSLPRIREAPQGFATPYVVDDETFLRMYCALRIAFPHAALVLSTRESPELRNRLARICITQISAGSSTSPGGYDERDAAHPTGQQFPICDHRSPAEMAQWLKSDGFVVAWE